MKNVVFKIMSLLLITSTCFSVKAQTKKTTRTVKSTHVVTQKPVEHNFGSPATVSDIKDITPNDNEYSSVKNLVENDKILLAYDDNTFHANAPLTRGDFLITFNSALESLNKMRKDAGVDSSMINTFDRKRNGAYLTSVSQIKDVNESSKYYPAAKSMIETWGISEPFTINKTLSPNSYMSEKEVYDILHTTLGYNSSAFNPYTKEITRGKFAIALNNALLQKGEQIADLHSQMMIKHEADWRAQQAVLAEQEKIRKDSISHVMELQKQAAANEALAAKTKVKRKSH